MCEQSTSKILWDNLRLYVEKLKRTPDSRNVKDKIKILEIKIANFNYLIK